MDNDDVDVELLVVADCPNEAPALVLLRAALDDIGLPDARFRTTVIATQEEAERRGFTGSPTILVDGSDPFAAPGAVPALACRVYRTHAGDPAGIPPLRELRQALSRAAGPPTPRSAV